MRPCFKIKASAGANKPAVIELYEETCPRLVLK